jgi:LuxR family maltose regulon positive regulatory protein
MQTTILQTKLYIPSIRAKQVARLHLLNRLGQGLTRRLILVSTPAGFGKTSLLAEWVRGLRVDVRVGWLSLDERDNALDTFLNYLIASLQAAGLDMTETTRMLANAGEPSFSVNSLLVGILNQLTTDSGHTILVLDDFHIIDEQKICDAVAFLLSHAPANFHLVILTRIDPLLSLSRLRSRNQMVELRAEDLRFSLSETTDFLITAMGLQVSESDVAALERRTEGWITGLQMAALSLQGREDVRKFVDAFTGSHRFVMDYLTDEVLDRQPQDVRDFLLGTSILDRLSGPLCDALTGRTDGQIMLEQLDTANLFLFPLDDERCWYRYHHLFADLLQNRLRQTAPGKITWFHRRASQWYLANEYIEDALHHAAAIPDDSLVASILEERAISLIDRGYIRLVDHWLHSLPEEILIQNPVLGLCMSICAHHIPPRDLKNSHEWLQVAEKALDTIQAPPDRIRDFQENIAANRINLARMADASPETILELIAGIMDRFPEMSPDRLAFILFNEAAAHLGLHDIAAAERTLERIWAFGPLDQNPYDRLAGISKLIDLSFQQGDLRKAARLCLSALASQDTGNIEARAAEIPAYGLIDISYGDILLSTGDLEQAKHYLQLGYERLSATAEIAAQARALIGLLRVGLYQGDLSGANESIGKIRGLQSQFSQLAELLFYLNKYQSDVSELDEVERLLAEQPFLPDVKVDLPGVLLREERRFYIQLMQANARIALFREKRFPDLDSILAFLEAQIGYARLHGWIIRLAQLLAVQALALQALGERKQALDATVNALILTNPCGCVGIYLDLGTPFRPLLVAAASSMPTLATHANQIATLINPPAQPNASSEKLTDLIEPLTEREQDVLRLMAAGLSNPEVGRELYLSLNTIKTHVRGIYGKLGVNNRTQAANRARELNLI